MVIIVDDEWRRWVAENLHLGADPEDVQSRMISAGIPAQAAQDTVKDALASPYFRGADLLRARLSKRDWLLESLSKLNRMHPEAYQVPRRHRLSRDTFLRDHYSQNRPVIITGMMDDWPAMTKWTLDYFVRDFGDCEIEAQIGRSSDSNYEINQPRHSQSMLFGQFVETIRTIGLSNDLYMTARNSGRNRAELGGLWRDIVQVPEYLEARDDAGFLWLGPAGTLTPFHHDLTNNFMAQVIGRKRILLIPSSEIPRTYNNFHVYSLVDGQHMDFDRFPALREAVVQELTLHPGEILFLPVGCWHFVEALDISCTMSFTNFLFDNDFASFYSTYQNV